MPGKGVPYTHCRQRFLGAGNREFRAPAWIREPVVPTSNLLLASLSRADAETILPLLRKVDLRQQTILFDAGTTIDHVYFPGTALVSLVVTLASGQTVEAAMVGRDGIVGALAALDGRLSFSRAIVQLSGDGFMCDVAALKRIAMQSETFHSLLIRHEQAVYAQAQQSAACIANHHVEARLARWMLRARDLSGSDTLPFTQEFLGEMLGVQRTSVSVVAHTLQQAGLIKYTRGRIQITNVDGLEQAACECYGTVKENYRTLLGDKVLGER
jgi:CRP-like cAMP-binding protein